MAYTFTFSNGFKYALATKQIDFTNDTFVILLTRDGYVFEPDNVRVSENVDAESLGIQVEAEADDDSFTRVTGNFETDGYIPGNMIWTDMSLNPGPFTIDTVATGKISVNEPVVDQGPSAGITIYSNDELEQTHGYTPATLSGVVVTENDIINKASITWDDVSWTATGGNIGPTPGALIIDTTANFVLGYLNFDGDKTATVGNDFDINNIALYSS
jgi:hypothetical protein